jgi:hypothetical protein
MVRLVIGVDKDTFATHCRIRAYPLSLTPSCKCFAILPTGAPAMFYAEM